MSNNYLPSLYQEYIYKSRYARWLPDKNRRENWSETVDRYFNFFDEHLEEFHKFKLDKKTRNELSNAVRSLDIMPSMRCLMTAGEALKRENVAGYNCFAADTKILTKEYGIVPISEVSGKDVHVLTSEKEWIKSPVRNFGQQDLYEIIVGYNKYNQKVYATENHEWVVDGIRKKTSELTNKDIIPFITKSRKIQNKEEYTLGVIHGLIYGDGTVSNKKESNQDRQSFYQKRHKGYVIRLCGDVDDLIPYFSEYSKSYPKTYNGDPVIYLYDGFANTHDLKSLPTEDIHSEDYMIGFFRGWMAADGYVSKDGQVSICVDDNEEDWLRKYMPIYGYIFGSSRLMPQVTNFGVRNKNSKTLYLFRPSLTKEDFLIKRKADRFSSFDFKGFAVRSVTKTDRTEDVYCVTVPGTHDFVLDGGILTGNCAYVAIDSPRSFDEILYILMNGTGVGFSVESKYVEQLPVIAEEFFYSDTTIVVADSKLGWAKSLKELIHLLYSGQIPKWDVTKVRPAGSILKTFGGRASGPGPLVDLFKFCVSIFRRAAGRKLTTLECHDIICKIAEIVVVGGVRRSALISLSDLSDDRMRYAKSGEWWKENVQRALANNSFVAKEIPDMGIFMKEWQSLYESRSGERGIFSRTASVEQTEKYGRRDSSHEFGTNPCSEIILRSREFCNLTEVVVRATDTPDTLKEKIRLATILGTMQSTLTNFKYLSKKYKENCEEERLLGVSLTGIMDNEYTNFTKYQTDKEMESFLSSLRITALETNKDWSKKIGISPSVAITCVKPSGTVSQLVDSASGIHARHAPYYVRTVRADKKDPLAKMMIDLGFPAEDDVTKPDHTYVFSFPMKSPDNAIFRQDMSAIEQLEIWLTYQRYFCEHKPSVTVSVKESEWMEVGAWVYKHFDEMSGVSFLPFSDHVYRQAPYQDCSKEEYEELSAKMPKNVDWSKLAEYEKQDSTIGSQELACVSGSCEL